MRVSFYSNDISFEPDSLLLNGLGGSESALLNLTREWAKNHPEDELTIYNSNRSDTKKYNGITWKNIFDFHSDVRTINLDCLVSLREPGIFSLPYIDTKLKVLWSQDIMNESRLIELQKNKYGIANIDLILANSNFSYYNLMRGFPNSDIKILLNGYNDNWIDHSIKKEDVAIYTSTPFRGISYLLELWPRILDGCRKNDVREMNPKLEIFGGMDLYNQSNDYFSKLYNDLSQMENTTVLGSVSQKVLYDKMKMARLLLYPCNYVETSCMAVLEAISCDVWIISTSIGALGELIINNKSGNIICSDPETEYYKNLFVAHSVDAFMSKYLPYKEHLKTWDDQAEEMRNIVMERLNETL